MGAEILSHALLESLAELQDLVLVKDLQGRYLMVNDGAAAILGLTPAEMIGKLDSEVLPEQIYAEQHEHDTQVEQTGEPVAFEGPMVVQGEPHAFRTVKSPLRDADGKLVGIVAVATDLSAGKHGEEALRRSQAQLAEAQELTAVGSWQWEVDGDRRTWSDGLFRIFGMDPAEGPLTWEGFLALVHPEDRPVLEAAFNDAMAKGTRFSFVHRLVRRDGEERVFTCSASFERDLDGSVVRVVGACQDITERQREAERIREREAQLNEAQKLTGVGSWEWDMDADTVVWSENLFRIFGLDPEGFDGTYGAYLEAVHPDDREARRAAIESVVATGNPDRGEHRIVRPDGEIRSVECTATLVEDPGGGRRLLGTCLDVTELRRLERELAERALIDPLTGLGNRALAYDRLAHALQVAGRRGSVVAALYLDIDGFKEVNDELGHVAGDDTLRAVAERLKGSVRESDTLARIGGDEFLVVCEDLGDPGNAEAVAERARACFRDEFPVGSGQRRLTCSVGVAFAGGRDVSVDDLIGEADAAMYKDKARRGEAGR